MRYVMMGVACLALAGCGKAPDRMVRQNLDTYDIQPPGIVAPSQSSVEAPSTAPQIAYTYATTYALGDADIAPVQARHAALCRGLGPARCLVVKTSLTGVNRGAGTTSGETHLLVDARLAPDFGRRLDASNTAAGGTVAERKVDAEDVTKQIVDTDARVRAKQALATRLLGLINSADGKVADLVAAERAFAETQEELDAARSLRETLRQRVAMSAIDLTYVSSAADSAAAPIRRSVGGIGETLASSMAALVNLLVAAIPWALLLAGLVWIRRRLGWRWPFRRPAV